ncbi:MAG: D-glycero-alpha-D-manno-heptose-1,7-bisphosphate 7-phosphatase [Bdellovibrionales bacterium]
MKKKAVFLDRDGTIIIDKIYLNDVNGVEYIPYALDSLLKLQQAGFLLLVATNQSGVARGIVQLENLHAIHEKIQRDCVALGVQIDGFYYAPYSVESHHEMRKPNPGMLLQGAKEHQVDLSKSYMIGDRESDVEAGLNAGTKSILLSPKQVPSKAHFICEDLRLATDFILRASQ